MEPVAERVEIVACRQVPRPPRDDWQGRRAVLGIDRSQAGLVLGSNRFSREIRAANKLSAELDQPY